MQKVFEIQIFRASDSRELIIPWVASSKGTAQLADVLKIDALAVRKAVLAAQYEREHIYRAEPEGLRDE